MSERDTYEAGVPCWIDTLKPDAQAAMAFYGGIFGWDFDGGPDDYFVARKRARAVAGVGAGPPEAPSNWNTYVSVDSAEADAVRARSAGGTVLVEPFDVPPAGRVAVVADPTGAAIGLWEPQGRHGAQLVNEPGAWAMSLLTTPDTDRAAAFYGELFGWTTEAFGDFSMFRLPGYVGGEPEQPVSREVIAVMAPAADGAPAHWRPDFWVDDVDAAAATAAERGGSVVMPPTAQPPGRSAVLADPTGATFSVSAVKP